MGTRWQIIDQMRVTLAHATTLAVDHAVSPQVRAAARVVVEHTNTEILSNLRHSYVTRCIDDRG